MTPDQDLDPRVQQYLESMMQRNQRVTNPEYQSALRGSMMAENKNAINRATLAGFTEGVSKLGTLQGKSPDVSDVTRTAQRFEDIGKARRDQLSRQMTETQGRGGMDLRVHQYLQNLIENRQKRAADLEYRKEESKARREDASARQKATIDAAVYAATGNQKFRASEAEKERQFRESEGEKNRQARAKSGPAKAPVTRIMGGVPHEWNPNTQKWDKVDVPIPEKEPKKEQFDVAGFARRLEAAEEDLSSLENSGYDRSRIVEGIKGSVLPEAIRGNNAKRQNQAERNFINSVLRRESGAVISDKEFENAELQYFPRAGDTPDVKAQKKRNRLQKIIEFKAAAGPAYEKVPLAPKELRDPSKKSGDFYQDGSAPSGNAKSESGPRAYSKSRNKTRIFYSDGTTEDVDGDQRR